MHLTIRQSREHQNGDHLHAADRSGRLSACFRSTGWSSRRSSCPSPSSRGPSTSPGLTFKPTLNAWKFLLTGPTSAARCIRSWTNSAILAISAAPPLPCFIGALAGYGLTRFRYYRVRTQMAEQRHRFLDHLPAHAASRRDHLALS